MKSNVLIALTFAISVTYFVYLFMNQLKLTIYSYGQLDSVNSVVSDEVFVILEYFYEYIYKYIYIYIYNNYNNIIYLLNSIYIYIIQISIT